MDVNTRGASCRRVCGGRTWAMERGPCSPSCAATCCSSSRAESTAWARRACAADWHSSCSTAASNPTPAHAPTSAPPSVPATAVAARAAADSGCAQWLSPARVVSTGNAI